MVKVWLNHKENDVRLLCCNVCFSLSLFWNTLVLCCTHERQIQQSQWIVVIIKQVACRSWFDCVRVCIRNTMRSCWGGEPHCCHSRETFWPQSFCPIKPSRRLELMLAFNFTLNSTKTTEYLLYCSTQAGSYCINFITRLVVCHVVKVHNRILLPEEAVAVVATRCGIRNILMSRKKKKKVTKVAQHNGSNCQFQDKQREDEVKMKWTGGGIKTQTARRSTDTLNHMLFETTSWRICSRQWNPWLATELKVTWQTHTQWPQNLTEFFYRFVISLTLLINSRVRGEKLTNNTYF